MFVALLGAQLSDNATGATIGRWIDENFVASVSIAVAVVLVVAAGFALLLRGYERQRRKNRRLRRHHELHVERQLEVLHAKVDELRADVAQLGELEDHVVGQLRVIGDRLADAERAASPPPLVLDDLSPRGPRFSSSSASAPAQPWGTKPPLVYEPALLVETGEPLEFSTRPR